MIFARTRIPNRIQRDEIRFGPPAGKLSHPSTSFEPRTRSNRGFFQTTYTILLVILRMQPKPALGTGYCSSFHEAIRYMSKVHQNLCPKHGVYTCKR